MTAREARHPLVPDKRPAYEPATRLLRPPRRDPNMRRPASTVAGAVLVLLRAVSGLLVLSGLAVGWDDLLAQPGTVIEGFASSEEGRHAALLFVLAVGGSLLALDVVLAVFVLRGHNWARIVVMIVAVVSISTSFFAWWAQGQEIKVDEAYVSLALDILVLLALSSRSAAAYARRNERR